MGNKCSLNRYGLGAKHLTDDVVQSSPLPPLPLLLHWSYKLVCRCPPSMLHWRGTGLQPPLSSLLHWGTRLQLPPILRAALGDDGVCGDPSVLHEPRGGGGGSALQPGNRRVSPERSPSWAPSAAPLLPPLPPQTARLPPYPKGVTETKGGPQGSPQGAAGGGRERQAPPPPPGSKDILFFLPRTKDNEKREDSGTYPAKSSPSAGNGGPEDGALLPSSPCPRRRTAPRPPGEGRGAGTAPEPGAITLRSSAAPHGSPARRPPSPRNPQSAGPDLAPETGTRSARRASPLRATGKAPGSPAAAAAASPAILCRVCERVSPSPLNSFLPSPPHNMAARSLLTAARKGRARAPAPYLRRAAQRPLSPRPQLRTAPPSAARAALHWPRRALPDRPERAHRFYWPRRALLRPPHPGPARTATAASHWPRSPPQRPPPSIGERRRPLPIGSCPPPRAAGSRPVRTSLPSGGGGRRAAGAERPPRRRPWALLPPPLPRPTWPGASPAPPRLVSALTPLGLGAAFPSSPRFGNLFIPQPAQGAPRQPAQSYGEVQPPALGLCKNPSPSLLWHPLLPFPQKAPLFS